MSTLAVAFGLILQGFLNGVFTQEGQTVEKNPNGYVFEDAGYKSVPCEICEPAKKFGIHNRQVFDIERAKVPNKDLYVWCYLLKVEPKGKDKGGFRWFYFTTPSSAVVSEKYKLYGYGEQKY